MRLMKLKEVIEMTRLAKSTIYKLQSEDKFPKSVTLSARAVAWVESEVQDWIREKVEERETN